MRAGNADPWEDGEGWPVGGGQERVLRVSSEERGQWLDTPVRPTPGVWAVAWDGPLPPPWRGRQMKGLCDCTVETRLC